MRHYRFLLLLAVLLVSLLTIVGAERAVSQTPTDLTACQDFAYSTEEDFVTQGPLPGDGDPIISDGDLLNLSHTVCMRNRDLLRVWDLDIDLGLDAIDVIDGKGELAAFSTELNDPAGRFTAGDLLNTWGATIPNQALLIRLQIQGDRGLDAVHFVGKSDAIFAFNELAASVPREKWLEQPTLLLEQLQRHGIDIWFSIEGTELLASTEPVLDGDLLSVLFGRVIAPNSVLLPAGIPAGLPARGVDFGLDGFTASRRFVQDDPRPEDGHFTTEILYRQKPLFSDGDVLKVGNGVAYPDTTLYAPFEPNADFLGTDALHINLGEPDSEGFLPLILKMLGRRS